VKSPQETSFHASALLWLKVSFFISTPSGLNCKIHQITTALPINIAESQSFSESSPSSMTRNARAFFAQSGCRVTAAGYCQFLQRTQRVNVVKRVIHF
jgi:hypothetical protein